MADLSDVETVLVALIAQLLYPDGTAADSVTGDAAKIYRGWPTPPLLDADLKAGVVNVSVFPLDGEQNTTRYALDWAPQPPPRITLTATVSGSTVTFGGTACCPLNAAAVVNGAAFVYPLQARDTPTSVATALAALTGGSNSGPVLTIPGAITLAARLGTVGDILQEVKRQKKSFRVTVWCHAPLVRDAVASAIDAGLAAVTSVSLPDGATGRLIYQRTRTADGSQKSLLYRRDLEYSVEYPTVLARRAAAIVAEQTTVTT